MKIAIIVAPAEHGYSFLNQADALAKGFTQLAVPNQIVKMGEAKNYREVLGELNPDFVISVGDWHDYSLLVAAPHELKLPTIPWLVADGAGGEHVAKYNKLPVILTPSEHCKKTFVAQGIKEELLTVVPEAVDPEFWHPLAAAELESFLQLISPAHATVDLPLQYDLVKLKQAGIPILFTTGGDATSKGAQEVITALGQTASDIPWVYMIKTWPSATSFSYSQAELTLAKKLGIDHRIRYIVGEFSQVFMRGLMNTCDLYVAPSRREGFGLPFIEAQMCGKPVIAIAANALTETVLHEKTGFLARPAPATNTLRADINDLAGYLKLLLTNPARREKMGHAARDHVTAMYAPPVIAQTMLTILKVY
ncbi:MAG: glycosyltransferase family 4 protein [Candidatus Andersenbacteria bacterium]